MKILLTLAVLLTATLGSTFYAQTTEKGVTIIDLTQTEGEFNTKMLQLAPGKYQFKVTNAEVDKEVGFVIQKAADKDGDLMKTAVENSFTTALVKKGSTEYTGVV